MSKKSTRLLRVGRPDHGWVNTAPVRGSTYTFDSIQEWRDVRAARETERVISYGARGNDTCHALEDALIELEGGHRAFLFPTGQAAVATVLAGLLSPGDHILLSDAVYEPVRSFCQNYLRRIGIEVTYYLPCGEDLEDLLQPNTKVVYVESPGTATFDMVDLPSVVKLAKRQDAIVMVDSTWGSGWLYRPLELGADISMIAATKYIGGHSDLMMGAVVANQKLWPLVQKAAIGFGQTVSGDDAFLALRGLRTLALRLGQHGAHATRIAQWLETRPEINRVYFPALASDPNHRLWKRDCTGANGLVTVEFQRSVPVSQMETMIDSLELFGIGASWGGYESLVLPVDLTKVRTRQDWRLNGPMMRLHIGLEDPEDLISDLSNAFAHITHFQQLAEE